MIGSKFSHHFFNQSEVKPKPIVARACTFSRALCRLRVITSSFDWFTGLSPSFLIGQSNYFGFGFTTLIRKPLYFFLFQPIMLLLCGVLVDDHVLDLLSLFAHGHERKYFVVVAAVMARKSNF